MIDLSEVPMRICEEEETSNLQEEGGFHAPKSSCEVFFWFFSATLMESCSHFAVGFTLQYGFGVLRI